MFLQSGDKLFTVEGKCRKSTYIKNLDIMCLFFPGVQEPKLALALVPEFPVGTPARA